VRWACGQAEGDAFSGLLDDLRLNGEYARLVASARAKLDHGEPPDTACPQGDAILWYFAQRRGTAVPDDLAGYARSCGFGDEQAFRTAVRHEYRYAPPE
jgi:AraC-like DNA-binding protein